MSPAPTPTGSSPGFFGEFFGGSTPGLERLSATLRGIPSLPLRHQKIKAGRTRTRLMGAMRPQTPHRSPRQAFGGNIPNSYPLAALTLTTVTTPN
jgi:hypothetical protein